MWQYWNSIGKSGKIVADNKEKLGPGRRWTNLSLAAHARCWPVDYAAISFAETVAVANTALEQKRADAEKSNDRHSNGGLRRRETGLGTLFFPTPNDHDGDAAQTGAGDHG